MRLFRYHQLLLLVEVVARTHGKGVEGGERECLLMFLIIHLSLFACCDNHNYEEKHCSLSLSLYFGSSSKCTGDVNVVKSH